MLCHNFELLGAVSVVDELCKGRITAHLDTIKNKGYASLEAPFS